MYNFNKREKYIKDEAKKYGVKLELINGKLQFLGNFHGSESVEKYLIRIMATYNRHVDEGF